MSEAALIIQKKKKNCVLSKSWNSWMLLRIYFFFFLLLKFHHQRIIWIFLMLTSSVSLLGDRWNLKSLLWLFQLYVLSIPTFQIKITLYAYVNVPHWYLVQSCVLPKPNTYLAHLFWEKELGNTFWKTMSLFSRRCDIRFLTVKEHFFGKIIYFSRFIIRKIFFWKHLNVEKKLILVNWNTRWGKSHATFKSEILFLMHQID